MRDATSEILLLHHHLRIIVAPPKDLCTAERFWEMATKTSGILLLQLTWWLICVQQKDKTTATTFLGCRCNCLLLRSPQIRGRSHAGANRSSKTRSAINGLETAVWFIVHAHNWCIWWIKRMVMKPCGSSIYKQC